MKKILILTLLISAVSLTACGTTTSTTETTIEHETLTDSADNSCLVLKEAVWVKLGKLETYPEFRAKIDEIFGIRTNSDGKSGCMYVNTSGKSTNNSTLRYAFGFPAFKKILLEHEPSIEKWSEATKELYADVESDRDALLAMIDAYFCLFNDGTQTEFDGNRTLTRAVYLTGVLKADMPVRTLSTNIELNYDNFSPFVNEMMKYSYLNLSDGSMNADTYNGAITRAEAIYTLVKMYYSEELDLVSDSFDDKFEDAKNGGYNTDTTINHATELVNAMKNPDGGMPADLYKALVVASTNNIISGTKTNWDASITKAEAIEMITRVYLDKEAWTDEKNETIEAKQLVFRASDGTVGYTKAFHDAVIAELIKAGVDVAWTNDIINDYFEVMEGKDNSSINMEVLGNVISSLDKQIDAQKDAQQTQKEHNHQTQQNNNNNSNSNEAPSDWVTPEKEPEKDPWAGDGSFTFDNLDGDGGNIIGDTVLNP